MPKKLTDITLRTIKKEEGEKEHKDPDFIYSSNRKNFFIAKPIPDFTLDILEEAFNKLNLKRHLDGVIVAVDEGNILCSLDVAAVNMPHPQNTRWLIILFCEEVLDRDWVKFLIWHELMHEIVDHRNDDSSKRQIINLAIDQILEKQYRIERPGAHVEFKI